MPKTIVGLVEKIKIIGPKKVITTAAKFDTGARANSIDINLAKKTGLEIIDSTKVTSASIPGKFRKRPVVEVVFKINNNKFRTKANLTDRSHLAYPVLIGRNLIYSNFVIDIEKTHDSHKENNLKEHAKNELRDVLKKIKSSRNYAKTTFDRSS